jgi:uncharacterized protein with LGFP repeats
MNTGTDNLVWHQNGADGGIPNPHVDGALWKLGSQQGDGPPTSYVASPWLSPIIVDAMVRVYGGTERADVADFIRRMGTYLVAATKTGADQEYGASVMLRKPDYVTLIDGSTYAPDGVTGEHALEVAGALGWAWYFSRVTGQPNQTYRTASLQLYETYDYGVNFWTRPTANASGLTAYRVAPWRKFNWEHKPSGSLSWCHRP